MALYWLQWCSKLPHFARVTAASVSEMECIPSAHWGWADRTVA